MKMLITATAMMALVAGMSTAKAWDQQATDDEMSYEISQRAAGGIHGGAYASVPGPTRVRRATVPNRYDRFRSPNY